jgi:N-acylglucosamine-6-phosphate 2-epimerase
MGATAVVIGSAITRPETITSRFVQEIRSTASQFSSGQVHKEV